MGEYDRALAALVEGLALAEKVGDEALIPRFLNTLGSSGSTAATSTRASRCPSSPTRSPDAPPRRPRQRAERRAFIRNNEADAFMAGRSRERRPGPGRVAPHRQASATVPLDDVALRDALLREPGPARSAARMTPTPPGASPRGASRWRPGLARKVRGLGLADRGRERSRAAGLGRGGGGAAARGGRRVAIGSRAKCGGAKAASGRLFVACGQGEEARAARWRGRDTIGDLRGADSGSRPAAGGSSRCRWPARSRSSRGAEPAAAVAIL